MGAQRSLSRDFCPGVHAVPHWLSCSSGSALLISHGPLRVARTTPAVWLVPSLRRIGGDAPSGSGLSLELYAARGEYELFQIAIQAPEGGLTDVTVHVADLVGTDGARIEAARPAPVPIGAGEPQQILIGQAHP